MLLSGVQKLSLIDYPGKIACVVFTPGCNLRCGYCHNPEFVLPERIKMLKNTFILEKEFFQFLGKRGGLLDGVSICGGEPTMQPGLMEFMRKIKSLGFLIKLDTNGRDPKLLKTLLNENLVDYIAMDVKHTWAKYPSLVGPIGDLTPYKESVEIINNAPIEYEFRTTIIRGVHTDEDVKIMATQVHGARKYVLQNFRSGEVLDTKFQGSSFSEMDLYSFQSLAAQEVKSCTIRF